MAESQVNVHALRHVYKGQYVKVYTDDVNFELGLVQEVAASTNQASSQQQQQQPPSASSLLQQQYQNLLKTKQQAPQLAAPKSTTDTIVTVKTLTGFHLTVPISKLRRAFLVILDLNGVLGSRIVTRPTQTHQSGVIQLTNELRGGHGIDKDGRTVIINTAEAVQVTNASAFVARPNLGEFLSFLFKNFIVGVWTSGEQRNATPIIDFLFGPDLNNGVDYRKRLLFSLFRTDATSRPTPEKPFATIKDLDRAVFSTFVAEVPPEEETLAMGTPLSSSELFMTMSAGANLPAAPKSSATNSHLVSLFHVGNTIIIDDSSDKCSHPDNALCPTTFGDAECERLVLRVRPPYTPGTTKAACLLLTPNGMTQDTVSEASCELHSEDGLLRSIKVLNEVIDQDTLAPLVPEAREALRAQDLAASAALITSKQQQADKVREELHRIMMSGSGSGTSAMTSKVSSPLAGVPAVGHTPTPKSGESMSTSQAIMSLLTKRTATTPSNTTPAATITPSTSAASHLSPVNRELQPFDNWNSGATHQPTVASPPFQSPPSKSSDGSDNDDDSDSEGPCFESDESGEEALVNSGSTPPVDAGRKPVDKDLAKAKIKKAKLKERKLKKKAMKAASTNQQANTSSVVVSTSNKPVFTAIAKRPKAAEGKSIPPSPSLGASVPPASVDQPQGDGGAARGGYRGRGRGNRGGRGRGGADDV